MKKKPAAPPENARKVSAFAVRFAHAVDAAIDAHVDDLLARAEAYALESLRRDIAARAPSADEDDDVLARLGADMEAARARMLAADAAPSAPVVPVAAPKVDRDLKPENMPTEQPTPATARVKGSCTRCGKLGHNARSCARRAAELELDDEDESDRDERPVEFKPPARDRFAQIEASAKKPGVLPTPKSTTRF